MAIQARAQATRAAIIQAGLDLFDNAGYGDVGLVDVLGLAGVTKGAFYYHFSNKESIAAAILEEAHARILRIALANMESTDGPALERLIQTTFVLADARQHDQVVRVAFQLRQALPGIRAVGVTTFDSRHKAWVDTIERAKHEGDVLAEVDSEDLAVTIRAALLGVQHLSDEGGDDGVVGLGASWRVILRGIVRAGSLAYFSEYVSRMMRQYVDTRTTAQAR